MTLDLAHINTSVVVIAESNNPRLLNPDFLERNQIVPKGWTSKNVVVTPAFSNVEYDNGVDIQVEDSKLQFSVKYPDKVDWKQLLPTIVITYLEVLPHVSYRAVGLNYLWHASAPTGKEAEAQLKKNLLVDGPWLKFGHGITGANIEFQYRASYPYLSIRVGVREGEKEGQKVLESYGIHANLHLAVTQDQKTERNAFITSLSTRYDEAISLVKQLPLGT